MSRQTQSYDDKAIRGEELESLATSISQKIVDNGQVVAEAIDELDARTRALENRNPDVLGDAVADSLDAQVLKIGGQPIDTSSYELLSNKVTSWQGTPDNTHYPSEKLVKDGLDAKANASNAVGLADSVYRRLNETGDGWNKLAETTFTKTNSNAIGFFDVYYGQLGSSVGQMSAKFNVRTDSSGSSPSIYDFTKNRVSGIGTYGMCLVVKGVSGNVTLELWGYLPKDNISMAVVFRADTNANSDWKFSVSKASWTFYNYSGTSSSKPVADAVNNVQVTDATDIVLQRDIASPTNDNLVAMDASGLVKDSGKKAADFELVANKVTSVRAASSATDTAYPSEKAVATALDGKAEAKNFVVTNGAKGFVLTSPKGLNLFDGCFVNILNGYGGRSYRNITFAIRRAGTNTPIVHRYNTEVSAKDHPNGEIYSVYYGLDPSDENKTIILIVPDSSISGLAHLSVGDVRASWTVLYDTPSTTGLTQITPTEHTNVFGANKGSASVPVYVDASGAVTPCTDDFVHDGDVVSTYSSTGTAPVNGTAVNAALATSLTNVEYVAAQSGGGGNLNKTKNGSTTSVLAFMTTDEATSLWQSAWAAAN